MGVLFLIGWALLIGAFFAAAAEVAVRGWDTDAGIVVPARDLIAALDAGLLPAVSAALGPAAWAAADALLGLPAWLLLGAPGAALAWFCRPHRHAPAPDTDSLFLYDHLAARAREEGYLDGDDLEPSHDERPWPEDGEWTPAPEDRQPSPPPEPTAVAAGNRAIRPRLPDAVFDYLAGVAPRRECAWDCGCGSGQAAARLAERFAAVVATDPSAERIAEAEPHPRVRYVVAPAEDSGLPAASVDLVLAAQAAHGFDADAFAAEARRVGRPDAAVALVGYGLCRVGPEVDRVVDRLYADIVGAHWPPERRHIETAYADLAFPFRERDAPDFAIVGEWTAGQMLAYLATWSAVGRYRTAVGRDPLALIEGVLVRAWGDGPRPVRWPVFMRVGTMG